MPSPGTDVEPCDGLLLSLFEHSPEHALTQAPIQDASQLSEHSALQSLHLHDVKVPITMDGPAIKAPSIGNIPLAVFLKNRLRSINSLFIIYLINIP